MNKTVLYLRTDIGQENLKAGGSVTHTRGVIEGFISLGHNVICASSAMHDCLQQLNLKKLYYLHNLRLLSFLKTKLNALLSNIFFTKQVLHITHQYTIDVIYQRYSLLNCTGVLVNVIKKIPLILEYNGSEVWVDQYWHKKKRVHGRFLIHIIEQFNLKHATNIIVVSEVLKQDLVQRGIDAKKILVNSNGVDPAQYDPAQFRATRKMLRAHYNLNNKFVFGFIGTFNHWHGITLLQEVMPNILAKRSNVHFLMIGDGPLKQTFETTMMQKQLMHHITFTGLLPTHDARSFLASCDAFLCPTVSNPDGTRFFGSPTKLFEYMSLAKPIIAADLEQISDIIQPAFRLNKPYEQQRSVGLLVPPTVSAFTQALEYVLAMPESLRTTIGNNSRKKVIATYSWQQHVHRILTFIA